MLKHLFSYLIIFCIAYTGISQTSFHLSKYLGHTSGDSLWYTNHLSPDASPILITYKDTLVNNQTVLRKKESNNFKELLAINDKGYFLIGVYPGSQSFMQFGSPVRILPDTVYFLKEYSSEMAYQLFIRGRNSDKGTFVSKIKVEGNDSSKTPARNFSNCLVLTIEQYRTTSSGKKIGFKGKEWYAQGVGLVKAVRDYYQTDRNGKPLVKPQKVVVSLEKARINGEYLAGQ